MAKKMVMTVVQNQSGKGHERSGGNHLRVIMAMFQEFGTTLSCIPSANVCLSTYSALSIKNVVW